MRIPAVESDARTPSPLELRIHGRGGQGGVSCAKILAAVFARVGFFVQAFGDYGGERTGAPVRAFLRTARAPIASRNKIERPDHVLVLDESLLGPAVHAGLAAGGLLLVNSERSPEEVGLDDPTFRVACVDALAIARRHAIGTRAVVIVSTTMVGAAARALGLPLRAVLETLTAAGLGRDALAAEEAYHAVRERAPLVTDSMRAAVPGGATAPEWARASAGPVLDVTELRVGAPPGLATGSWSTSRPRHADQLAPCVAACPAGNDVVGFVQALAAGDVPSAAELLLANNPLPSVCGRVCPGFCLRQCTRRELDEAVDVRALERWLGDHLPDDLPARIAGAESAAARAASHGAPRVVVVGAGPAGLSASYALARAGARVTLVDAADRPGGLLATGIPAYRLPRAVTEREIARIVALGVHLRLGQRLDAPALAALAGAHDGLVVAAGLQSAVAAPVAGGQLPGVEPALGLLERVARGDRPPISGRVVVLGGGNTAVDGARVALRLGASEVVLAYRRTREQMPALAEEVDHALEEGVRLLELRTPVAFRGSSRVQAVVLAHTELGEPDARGRRRPVPTDRASEVACDHVLVALGQQIDDSIWPTGWTLVRGRLHRDGAALPAFACGDLLTAAGSVSHAIGSGRRAALALLAALDAGRSLDAGEHGAEEPAMPRAPVVLAPFRLERFDRVPRAVTSLLAPAERAASFAEVRGGLADPGEAQRCLGCGRCLGCDRCLWFCPDGLITRRSATDGRPRYEVDDSQCKGCGICAVECPREALVMVRS